MSTATRPASMRDYAVVTGAYWIFTLTDGALRTLVLLHLADLGFSTLAIATYFAAYEALGVVTNLVGGRLGARFGLKLPLVLGLVLQAGVCGALALGSEGLGAALLFASQGASGVAKDLVKAGAKSYVKLVVPDGEPRRLMHLVSLLTGSKNALKGVGFLLGGVLLGAFGFRAACIAMSIALVLALSASLALLPSRPGKTPQPKVRGLLSPDARINRLAAARFFLFASRDVWFVLAVPVFLRTAGAWSATEVSLFLALWTIGYGIVQAAAPRFVGSAPTGRTLIGWSGALVIPLVALAFLVQRGFEPDTTIAIGLAVWGVVFAANSAIHSFLVVRFAARDALALDVGSYYASNAGGRLVGTLASGWLYQAAATPQSGLVASIGASAVLAALAFALCFPLRAAERRAAAATVSS
jgi:MFS family permease